MYNINPNKIIGINTLIDTNKKYIIKINNIFYEITTISFHQNTLQLCNFHNQQSSNNINLFMSGINTYMINNGFKLIPSNVRGIGLTTEGDPTYVNTRFSDELLKTL